MNLGGHFRKIGDNFRKNEHFLVSPRSRIRFSSSYRVLHDGHVPGFLFHPSLTGRSSILTKVVETKRIDLG